MPVSQHGDVVDKFGIHWRDIVSTSVCVCVRPPGGRTRTPKKSLLQRSQKATAAINRSGFFPRVRWQLSLRPQKFGMTYIYILGAGLYAFGSLPNGIFNQLTEISFPGRIFVLQIAKKESAGCRTPYCNT